MKKYKGLYINWVGMKQRCTNPNTKSFKNYGGRGIKICDKWLKFKGFEEDMLEGYKKGLTIERIDNNNGYFKKNCRWATRKQQCENKRCNVLLNGKKLVDIAKELNLNYGTLRSRFYRGMTYEQITMNSLYRPQRIC